MDMSMSDPSPRPIFVWEDGRPCRIFVEATSVRERPKLVRKIIKYGGNVVNVVRDAEILLAENNTKEALELLDAWRGDKIVLGTRWVSSCVSQNRLLGENLGWGGCSLDRERLMEGISVPHEDSEEDVIGEIVPQLQMKSSTRSKSKATERPSKPDSPQRRTASSPVTKTQVRYTGDKLSRSSPSKVSRTRHTASQSSSTRKESLSPRTGSSPPQSERSSSSSQEIAQNGANFLSPFLDQQFPNFNQPLNIPSAGTTPQLAALYSQFSTNQLHLFQQFLMNSQLLNSQIPGQHGQNGPQQPQQQLNVSPSPRAEELRGQIERSKSDIIPTRGSVNPGDTQEKKKNVARKNKEKVRARSSSPGEVQTAIRSKPISSKPLPLTNGQGVFLDDWGMPKSFYIMVDLKNRKDLLKIVKKNQGAIVSTMDDADYIILNARSNQFQKVIEGVPLSKIALSPRWVEACDNEGRIVDMAPFVVDITSGGGGGGALRKRPQSRKVIDEATEYESEEDTLAARSAGSSRSPIIISPSESLPTAGLDMSSKSRSPTPPRRVVQMQRGRNLYTPEDRKWFFDYARFKLERNPDMSIAALEKLVGRKAPQHSTSSWMSHWRRNWGDEMTSLRQEISRLPRTAPNSSSMSPAKLSQSFNRPPHPSSLISKDSDGGSSLVHTPSVKRLSSGGDQGTQMGAHTTPPRISSMPQPSSSGNGLHSQASAKPAPLSAPLVLPAIESLPQHSPLASSSRAVRTPPIKSPLAPTTIHTDLMRASNVSWSPSNHKSHVSNLQTSAVPLSPSSHSPLRQASAEATFPNTWSNSKSPTALFHQASAQAASMHKPSDVQLSNASPVSPFSGPTIGSLVSQASGQASPMRVPPDRHQDDPIIVEDVSWKKRLSNQQDSDHPAKRFKVDPEGVIDVDAQPETLESR